MFRTSLVHLQERLFYKLYSQTLVCGNTRTTRHVQPQLDVSSSTRITTYQSLELQLLQNAPDYGPMRSEACRTNICDE